MNGQWIGDYTGSSSGLVILNLDKRDGRYEGLAYLFNTEGNIPATAAFVRLKSRSSGEFDIPALYVVDSESGNLLPLEGAKVRYPQLIFPNEVKATYKFDGGALRIEWTTDVGGYGKAFLPKSQVEKPSELATLLDIQTWSDFKEFASGLQPRHYLLRGQSRSWRLRTSFHRTGRADVQRFIVEDIPVLYRHLSGRMRHFFNLTDGDQNGAFFNLVQHHGYPTPLLDWTFSPFVAAFFAYREISNSQASRSGKGRKVRIFVFNQKEWHADWARHLRLTPPPQHLSILEFPSLNNERMIPQQAASSVTNVDDIETYIAKLEKQKKKTYLRAIDLPWAERRRVMQELSMMGITAGSLFPGLDGACEEIRERMF